VVSAIRVAFDTDKAVENAAVDNGAVVVAVVLYVDFFVVEVSRAANT